MLKDGSVQLDEQARWEFIQEAERYYHKLRSIEAIATESADLFRTASQEHLDRVTSIYAQAGARQRKPVHGSPA